jgi:Mlc titration factor MtfA (ptsG expression regulator)
MNEWIWKRRREKRERGEKWKKCRNYVLSLYDGLKANERASKREKDYTIIILVVRCVCV